MKASQREDYLEAIQLFTDKNSRPPRVQELATEQGNAGADINADLMQLVSAGDLRLHDDTIVLTDQGRHLGRRVIKKHETLQCFLSEMLGMDRSSASDEACTLEHSISDETIDRLGALLKRPSGIGETVSWRPEQGFCGKTDSICRESGTTPNSLLDFHEGDDLIVLCILGQSSAKRLLDLGVVPGERVRIRRKLGNRALVIQVKGCDVALSPEIAAAICVERSS